MRRCLDLLGVAGIAHQGESRHTQLAQHRVASPAGALQYESFERHCHHSFRLGVHRAVHAYGSGTHIHCFPLGGAPQTAQVPAKLASSSAGLDCSCGT